MIIKLLKGQFLQNNLEKSSYLLPRCFSIFYRKTLNPYVFKLLLKILLAEISGAVN